MQPFFSIIIPTRNRPELFANALKSVVRQTFTDIEIIVIDDGSTEDNRKIYLEILSAYNDKKIEYISLPYRPNGHNSSFTRNYGVQLSKGKYICFLDDDDIWTDHHHLTNAQQAIQRHTQNVDLYLTNQTAMKNDGTLIGNVWIEDLQEIILKNLIPDNSGIYAVTIEHLLLSNSFCHLNCSIYARPFYLSIGGLDENYRYEEDRDIYLRAIDQAKLILHNPVFIGRHHIPEKKKRTNVSTQLTDLDKYLFQLRTFDKGILFSKNKIMKNYCMKHKCYTLKNMSTQLYKDKKYHLSYVYAKEAYAVKPNIKWLGFIVLGLLKVIR